MQVHEEQKLVDIPRLESNEHAVEMAKSKNRDKIFQVRMLDKVQKTIQISQVQKVQKLIDEILGNCGVQGTK